MLSRGLRSWQLHHHTAAALQTQAQGLEQVSGAVIRHVSVHVKLLLAAALEPAPPAEGFALLGVSGPLLADGQHLQLGVQLERNACRWRSWTPRCAHTVHAGMIEVTAPLLHAAGSSSCGVDAGSTVRCTCLASFGRRYCRSSCCHSLTRAAATVSKALLLPASCTSMPSGSPPASAIQRSVQSMHARQQHASLRCC